MRLTTYAELDWTPRVGGRNATIPEEIRPPSTELKVLGIGEPGAPGNFEFVVARYPAPRTYPVHRHTVDQLRLTLRGSSPWDETHATPEGGIVLIPAGTPYGPYTRPAEIELMQVQFEGADAIPFAGDASSQDPPFPPARFTTPIELHPANFAWLDTAQGVREKVLGTFTEREVRLAMVEVSAGGEYRAVVAQRTLGFVVAGAGQANGQSIAERDGFVLDAGEEISVSSSERVEVFLLGMSRQADPA